MDILAARKKAAERARLQQERQKNPEQPTLPAGPPVEETLQAVPAPEAAASAASGAPQSEPVAGETPLGAPAPETETGDALQEEAQVRELEMLSFRLGGEEYAVMVEDVKEVLKNRDLTAVPNAPDHILGVTSLRGPILPVVDLAKRLGVPPAIRNEKTRILVVTVNDEDLGIVVDRVSGVVRIDPGSIRPVPDTLEHGAEYLNGIARKDERLYILLNLQKALGAA